MENRMNDLENGQNMIAKQLNELGKGQEELRKNVARMETELTEKVRALFDFREVQNDINERIISALGRIEAKLDVLQMETAHLRRIK
ncbi:MAG: hypothetical protein GX766_10880 [Firmicutes bacterium]|nr:hypothetical protein [Bacillota bacterium]